MERLYRAVVARFGDDSAEWRLTRRQALGLAIIPLVVAGIGVTAAPFPRVYGLLANEDGLVEWTQFMLLLALLGLSVSLTAILWRAGRRWIALLYLLAGAAAFFIAGEEVSWGQRIFGFLTPVGLEDINKQGEANIHNIGGALAVFNLAVLTVSLAALILPIARWTLWRDRPRSVAGYALIPPAALMTAFAIPLAYRSFRLLVLPEAGARITKYQEFVELTFYVGVVLFVFLARRAILHRLRVAATEDPAASPTADTSR